LSSFPGALSDGWRRALEKGQPKRERKKIRDKIFHFSSFTAFSALFPGLPLRPPFGAGALGKRARKKEAVKTESLGRNCRRTLLTQLTDRF
jgi:hypothetical protein